MLQRENAITFLAAWNDACALWRLYMPHLNLPGSNFYIFPMAPDLSVISGNDICVVQRCCTAPQFEFIKAIAQLGIRIVYDLDDNVWELPEYNPASAPFKAAREGFKACIRMVDVVSVSTKTLAMAVRQHVQFMTNARTNRPIPIVVAENRIFENMFVTPIKRPGLTIGWAGSSSHIGDLTLVEDALLAVTRELPTVQVEFRGCELMPGNRLLKIPTFRHKLWTPVAEFGARMPLWGWSIALVPVTANNFNRSKSCIKMVEAGYCKIPALASWVQPYEEFCAHDAELSWLLCSSPQAWKKKLRDLVNDEARREELGIRMYAVVKEHYSYSKTHEGWAEVFQLARSA